MIDATAHLPSFVHSLAHFVEPWKTLYSNSKTVGVCVMFAHVGALLIGGGFAVAADRMTLRAFRQGRDAQIRQLTEIQAIHKPILGAIAVLLVSGVLMAAADVETFAVSIPFWIKILCVTLLLVNGALLYKTDEGLRFAYGQGGAGSSGEATERLWRRLRATSIASLFLWIATTLAGTVLSVAS